MVNNTIQQPPPPPLYSHTLSLMVPKENYVHCTVHKVRLRSIGFRSSICILLFKLPVYNTARGNSVSTVYDIVKLV
jgi:hypothetical protein